MASCERAEAASHFACLVSQFECIDGTMMHQTCPFSIGQAFRPDMVGTQIYCGRRNQQTVITCACMSGLAGIRLTYTPASRCWQSKVQAILCYGGGSTPDSEERGRIESLEETWWNRRPPTLAMCTCGRTGRVAAATTVRNSLGSVASGGFFSGFFVILVALGGSAALVASHAVISARNRPGQHLPAEAQGTIVRDLFTWEGVRLYDAHSNILGSSCLSSNMWHTRSCEQRAPA